MNELLREKDNLRASTGFWKLTMWLLCWGEEANNLHRCSTLKEGEHNSPLLKCGLRTATSFQRLDWKRGGERVITEEKQRYHLRLVIQANSCSESCQRNMPLIDGMKWHSTSAGFLPIISNPSFIMRKISDKFQKRHDNQMQCGLLGGIQEKKKDIR